MVDFEVYRTAAGRALDAENLYRPIDGHYQFKYLPAFALAMAPFTWSIQVARADLVRAVVGLLCVFVRWSLHAFPVGG